MSSPERKELEAETYDRLYANRQVNAEPGLRAALLFESEDAFRDLVLKYSGSGERVLEIGFGDGTPSIWAAQNGAEVSSIDISSEAVSFAEERARAAGVGDRVRFMVGDVERMEFPDGSFDVIIDNEVFSSLDLSKALPEIVRVLKPGGVLIGKETFGHNPLFNAKRKLNVLRGARTEWAARHVMRDEDFALASRFFQIASRRHFHLLALFAAPLYFLRLRGVCRRVVGYLGRVDRWLLQSQTFQNQGFKVVFELRKP